MPGDFNFASQVGEPQAQNTYSPSPKGDRATRWLMRLSGGLIRTLAQARTVLLGFVVVGVIYSLYLLYGFFAGPAAPHLTLAERNCVPPENCPGVRNQ